MEPDIRRALAYVAGRLITRRKIDAIHDAVTDRAYRIGGHADDSSVNVCDYTSGYRIAGSYFGSTYSLRHDGAAANIELKITDNRFTGYEFGSASHFNGSVNGCCITLYDFSDGNFYLFSI